MSNAMSRSKSRWKGALLATVAASVITPLAANAQTTPGSMTLSLSLAPMSNVVNSGAIGTQKYIAPDQTYNIYVYATVAENGNVTSTNNAGLDYAYFNVLQNYSTNLSGVNAAGINTSDGTITSAATSPLFSGYGSQNGSIGATSGYYAVGGGPSIASQGAAIGNVAASALPTLGKARSASTIWSNGLNVSNGISYTNWNDGTNVYISGNKISFLLETLTYTPAFAGHAKTFSDPNLGENSFTVAVPTVANGGTYTGSNYFTGNALGANGSAGTTYTNYNSVGTSYTHSAYTAGNVTIGGYTFSNTVSLYDAAVGDAYLDGYIGQDTFGLVGSNYAEIFFGAGNVISGWTNGDFYNDGYVGQDSFGLEGSAYASAAADPNSGAYGPDLLANGPFAQVGSPTALIGGSAVPEPASISLLALASLGLTLGRRNRKSV